ncbi:proprotein convertase P-domain-containing protein [Allorhizocola rhizosphaerae]|uniref:proprotein convertase P-domain-containing protein n=1 Tax=Allorhizocola rhizosphaerae TaxID=1872709 RepID=UPI000E3E894C|nr:proprotein convertase P-domain-containing protein [Allorhizocola rhizosphaerae]
MKRLHRAIVAGATGLISVVATVAISTAGALGGDNFRTLALPNEAEQVRFATNGTYQLSADGGRTWSRALPEAKLIRLRSREFDPLTTVGTLKTAEAYIVQFANAPLDSQRRDLRRMGVNLGSYLPDNAYVARMSGDALSKVAKLPYVRWVGAYEPADKLAPGLQPGRVRISLVNRDLVEQGGVINKIEALGGTVQMVSASRSLIEATVDSAQLRAIAADGAVLAIDQWSAPETDMNNARADGGANAIETARGYRGQGVRGEVMDSGLRTTHQEFAARPPVMHTANGTSTSHGTSTYGQIFASGVNATHRGLLPEGQGIFAFYSAFAGGNRHAHTAQLVNPSGNYRAVFQSNSWGDALTTAYTTISADMDDIVFDHDILICQSQSNAGTRSSRPQAWAKNVVSVGGQYHRNTLDRSDDAWSSGASIGPAADGRLKPDLSNYYDQINTTSSTSDTSYTSTFGGTSGATPITCGNFGLLFQMWADGVFAGGPGLGRDVFASRPHAATAKALMVNQANQYTFSGTAHDLTRTHQGWGTASVGNLYNQAQANGWRLPILVNETDLLTVGTKKTYTITTDGTQPLKATLVWTDPAGSPSAAKAQVNDLTLRVVAPNGTVYWGNNGLNAGNWSTAGGVANTVDTVENVFVQNPAPGTWTVEVSADTLGADGHVETAATDADYALVVTARVGTPPTGTPTASPTASPTSGPRRFTNDTDFAINDNTTIESPITVTGVPGNAPSNLQVDVNITHTYRGDLVVTLVAPDGSTYVLHNRAGGSADNIVQVFPVDASSEVANGTWRLRVQDAANADVGTLNTWSLIFP